MFIYFTFFHFTFALHLRPGLLVVSTMFFTRNLNFVVPFVSTGDDLLCISTTDIPIPKGSEVALQSCQFRQRKTAPIEGLYTFTYSNQTTGVRFIYTAAFPKDLSSSLTKAALDAVVVALNFTYRLRLLAALQSDINIFKTFVGTTSGFSNDNGKLSFQSEQFFLRGVGSVLDDQNQNDLIQQNLDLTSADIEDDIIVLDPTQGDGIVQAIQPLPTDPITGVGLARFCPEKDRTRAELNGVCSLSVFTTFRPGATDVPVVIIEHRYRLHSSVAKNTDIKPKTPAVVVSVRGKIELILPTLNGTAYEIRKAGRFLVIHQNVENGVAPPVDKNDLPVQGFRSRQLLQIELTQAEFTLFPRWVLKRGGKDKDKSKKICSECFFVAETDYDPTQRLPYNPAVFEEPQIVQEITTVPQGAIVAFNANLFATQEAIGGVIGDPTGVLVGEAGGNFKITADRAFGTVPVPLPSTSISILEPFRIDGRTIFQAGFGNTVPSSVLARFNAETVHLSVAGDVVFSTDTPIFYQIEGPGDINARTFRFRISDIEGNSVTLQNSVFISLLVRSPTTSSILF